MGGRDRRLWRRRARGGVVRLAVVVASTRDRLASDLLATAPRLSLVVLPFENLSGDPEQEFFADGITDDLTTDLSHLPDSFVIARNTAFTYKGKAVDVKQIGRELGVRYVLEGSVRRVGEKITAERPADLDRNRRACLGRPVRRRAQQVSANCRWNSSPASPIRWASSW